MGPGDYIYLIFAQVSVCDMLCQHSSLVSDRQSTLALLLQFASRSAAAMVAYWAAVLVLGLAGIYHLVAVYRPPRIVARKLFHALILAIFIPVLYKSRCWVFFSPLSGVLPHPRPAATLLRAMCCCFFVSGDSPRAPIRHWKSRFALLLGSHYSHPQSTVS